MSIHSRDVTHVAGHFVAGTEKLRERRDINKNLYMGTFGYVGLHATSEWRYLAASFRVVPPRACVTSPEVPRRIGIALDQGKVPSLQISYNNVLAYPWTIGGRSSAMWFYSR